MALGPGLVVLIGVLVAAVIGFIGLGQLAAVSDERAAERAELFGETLAARLSALRPEERFEAMQLAARRTGAEFIILSRDGDIVHDASLGAMDRTALRETIPRKRGEATTGLGRTRFVAKPLEAPPSSVFLITFVREPSAPEGAPALVRALLALTILLVGVAAAVAYALARDANRDVEFVAQRVRAMAQVQAEPTGEAVPVRSMDEVGALTAAFNALVDRFASAERGYRSDLERVRAADRERASFLAAVSHELRSPLNAILGFTEILSAGVDGPLTPGAREEVEQIRGSGQHLLELISDILEFSALESGQLTLSKSRIDLAAIAGEVVREATGLLQGKPVRLRLDASGPVVVRGDAKRLRQVVTNLVANAIKFTREGEVIVTLALISDTASLAVSDTGPGIRPAELALIFDEYKQGAEGPQRRGTGLGLAIARRLVLLHGGTITVESTLGRGSTFRVALPIHTARARRR